MILIILLYVAKQNALRQVFSRYDFLKIYLRKIQSEFFLFIMILSRINKGVYLCFLSMQIQENLFMSIAAHS